jgi:hypothetical protein
MIPDEPYRRYSMVVDGEVLDGKRIRYVTGKAPDTTTPQIANVDQNELLTRVPGRQLLREVRTRVLRRLMRPFR